MTCQSCVKNIENVIGGKAGVYSVEVSLELKEAHIQFNPQITSPEVLREHIDDMGFEANLPPVSEAEGFDKIANRGKFELATTTILVEGMTCQSCVKNIEENMLGRAGVASIQVSLDKKKAVIRYNPTVTTPETLRDGIEDMGFEATLADADDVFVGDGRPAGQGAQKTAVTHVNIEGMTCQSCVQNIEGVLPEKKGVISVHVSLEAKNAVIQYNPALTSPETLREQIDDMGFEATLPETRNDSLSDFDPLKAKSSPEKEISNECRIRVEGMTCQSCVQTIESNMSNVAGILNIKVSLSEKEAQVQFKPTVLSDQDVADKIDDMGFEASVLGKSGKAEKKNLKSTVIKVKGMTCNSCVQNIEGVIGDRAGVASIKVKIVSSHSRQKSP